LAVNFSESSQWQWIDLNKVKASVATIYHVMCMGIAHTIDAVPASHVVSVIEGEGALDLHVKLVPRIDII